MDISIRLATLLHQHRVAWLCPFIAPDWTLAVDSAETVCPPPSDLGGPSPWGRVVIFSEQDFERAKELASEQGLIILIRATQPETPARADLKLLRLWQSGGWDIACFCRTEDLEAKLAQLVRPNPIRPGYGRLIGRLGTILRSSDRLRPLLVLRALRRLAMVDREIMRHPEFYASQLAGLAGEIDFAVHYLSHGAARGLNPSPDFDTIAYLRGNPDVAHADVNPLLHYLEHGKLEGRQAIACKRSGETIALTPGGQELLRRTGLDVLRLDSVARFRRSLATRPVVDTGPVDFSVIVTHIQETSDLERTHAALASLLPGQRFEVIGTPADEASDITAAVDATRSSQVIIIGARTVPVHGAIEAFRDRLQAGHDIVTGRLLDQRGALLHSSGLVERASRKPSTNRFCDPENGRFRYRRSAATLCPLFFAIDKTRSDRWQSHLQNAPSQAASRIGDIEACYEPRAIAIYQDAPSGSARPALDFPTPADFPMDVRRARPQILIAAQRFQRPNGGAASGANAALLADLKRLDYDLVAACTSQFSLDADGAFLGDHGIPSHLIGYQSQLDLFVSAYRRAFSAIIAIDPLDEWQCDILRRVHAHGAAPIQLTMNNFQTIMAEALPLPSGLTEATHHAPQSQITLWMSEACNTAHLQLAEKFIDAIDLPTPSRIVLVGRQSDAAMPRSAFAHDTRCIWLGSTAHLGKILSRSCALVTIGPGAGWTTAAALAEDVPVFAMPHGDIQEVAAQLTALGSEARIREASRLRQYARITELTSLSATKARLERLGLSDLTAYNSIESD